MLDTGSAVAVSPLYNKMKKIAFILPRMGIGGVERSFLGLLKYAPVSEFEITLILLSEGGELLEDVPDYVHIRYAHNAGWTEKLRTGLSYRLKRLRLHRLFMAAKAGYHMLGPKLVLKDQNECYDAAVAYSDGLATWYTAKAVNARKKIAFVHTDFSRAGYSAAAERPVYNQFEEIFFGSEVSKDHFLALMPELQDKTALLPNCVDSTRIIRLAQEPCERFGGNGINILTVSRLSHEKGLDKIPQLLQMMRKDGFQVHWYIIGDGPERVNLVKSAKLLQTDGQLTLLGAKKNPYPYMAQCDIYVQPSNYEGYCIALAEARVLCIPCVACDFAGAREQIEDGVTGFVTGMEAGEIYAKLKLLIQSKKVQNAFRESILLRKENVSSSLFMDWWYQL